MSDYWTDEDTNSVRFQGRAACPECKRSRLINKQGKFRKHVIAPELGSNRPPRPCPGSGTEAPKR